MTRSLVGCVTYVRDGVWRVRVQRGRRPDGKPLVVTETHHGTHESAVLRAATIAADLGHPAPLPPLTLSAYYWHVFRDKPSNRGTPRTPATLRYYDDQMRLYVLPSLGGVRLDRITHAMLAACVRSSHAPTNTRRTIRAVLRSAYDDGYLSEDVSARRVPVQRHPKPRTVPWDASELRAALAAPAPPAIRAYLALGLCGLRKEECLGARACDVSVSEGSASVTVAWTYTDAGGHVPRAKNAHSLRTVPAPAPAVPILAAAVTSAPSPTARLVPLRGDRLYVLWMRWCASSGLRPVPPSTLRHSTDTLMLSAGVPPDLVDRLHGRSQHASTYASYYRPGATDLGAAADALARALGGGPGKR